jgi:hypothetical protein
MVRKDASGEVAAVGFLLFLNLLYFFPVLVEGNSAVLSYRGTDTWGQFFYWRHFAYESLARGEIPLWNPYVFSGAPFVAGIQSAIFYPLNLLFLIFPTPFAINFSIALHCFLASLFTYLYARYLGIGRSGATLSGACFAYGSPYFLHVFAGHLPNLSTMIWLPLLFLGIEVFLETRDLRYAVYSGIALALQLFAGHPQYVFYSLIAVSLYFLIRLIMRSTAKDVPNLLTGYSVFLVTGLLLAAVQLLPTVEFTRNSFREALTYDWVAIFSLPPEMLLTMLIPDFFGDISNVPYWGKNYLWEMSLYIGVIPLSLAVVAVIFEWRDRVLAFSLLAATALILALGKYTPLLRILFNFLPGFDRFRGLSKFGYIFSFAMAMLAGFGFTQLAVLAETKKNRLAHLSYALLGIPFFLVLLAIVGPFSESGWWYSLIESYVSGDDRYSILPPLTNAFVNGAMSVAFSSFLKSCALLTILGACVLVLVKKRAMAASTLGAVVLLAAMDLWHFGSRYLVEFSPKEIAMDQEVRAFLRQDREPFRIASPLDEFINTGVYEGIENVGGYDTLALKRYTEFINFAQGLPLEEPSNNTRVRAISPLLDLLNVRYFIVDASTRIEHPGFQLVFENSSYHVYQNQSALPRSFIVHDARVIKDRDEAFRLMASPGFNPASVAIVEEKVDSLAPDASIQSPPPRFLERSADRILLEANLNKSGLLVLADAFYPGWKSFVDGQESKIYRANYVLRAIFVPAGKHRVEFKYDPWSVKAGALISIVTLLLVVGWLMWTSPTRSR